MPRVAEHSNTIEYTLGVGVPQTRFEIKPKEVHTVGALKWGIKLARDWQRSEPFVRDRVPTVLGLEKKEKVLAFSQHEGRSPASRHKPVKKHGNRRSGRRPLKTTVSANFRYRRHLSH